MIAANKIITDKKCSDIRMTQQIVESFFVEKVLYSMYNGIGEVL